MNKNEKLSIVSVAAIIGIILISVPSISAQSDNDDIPSWIKIIAGSWYKGEVSDTTFLNAMTSLIESEIIVVPGYGKIVEELTIEEYELTVTTDKESYVGDETMIVSGTLPDYGSSTVVLLLTSPSNMIVSIGNIIPDGNGYYSKTMALGMSAMNENGTYKLVVKYQSDEVQTTIEYSME